MKHLRVFCAAALLVSALFLASCAGDGEVPEEVQKDHYYEILDGSDGEILYTVTAPESVDQIDTLLGDDWADSYPDEGTDDARCTYVYYQEKTLLAGQDPEAAREYEELFRVAVQADSDTVTIHALDKALPGVEEVLPQIDVGDLLTFSMDIPKETADALRDPAQFAPADP